MTESALIASYGGMKNNSAERRWQDCFSGGKFPFKTMDFTAIRSRLFEKK
jgi:hypothetical protein